MAARDHKNRTPLAPLSSYFFFTILDFLSQKVKRICQARFSVSARVAILGLASRELHSVGDGHQPAQPSVCGCESAAPSPLFSRARSSSLLDFFSHSLGLFTFCGPIDLGQISSFPEIFDDKV
jgi:hypothetical protein